MAEQHIINLEHRLEVAQAEIKALQERVAYAETARDNAQTLADEVQARSKTKVTYAGRLVADLLKLLQPFYASQAGLEARVIAIMAKHTPPETPDVKPE